MMAGIIVNSFSTFVDDEGLSNDDRIQRDLFNFLTNKIGHGLYSRGDGSPLTQLENSENSVLEDALIKVSIMQAVGDYNMQAVEALRAIVGYEMIEINREGSNVDILVIFIPMSSPSVDNLKSMILSVPGGGGG